MQNAGMEAHDRLKAARIEAGYKSASDAARALGVVESTYAGHENGARALRPRTAEQYARKFRVRAGWLLHGEEPKSVARPRAGFAEPESVFQLEGRLRVLGRVAAGAWLEVDPVRGYDEPMFEVPVPLDPRFPRGALFGLLVEGTSLNKLAREGDILVCLDTSAGFSLNDNDLVVIERLKEQDGTREVTAKRARFNGKTFQFWPESTDPRWQEPISSEGQKGYDIRVVARVEWIFRSVR